jgi:ribosomal-protein-alanine N-acetyltransferase
MYVDIYEANRHDCWPRLSKLCRHGDTAGMVDGPKSGTTGRWRVLPMLRSDLDAVCRVATDAFPVPWTRHEFDKELARPHARIRVLRPDDGAPICAFVNYWTVGSEVQVMNVATSSGFRRRGFARALLQDVLGTARDADLQSVTLEVRRSNEAAIGLYAALGFDRTGIRPRYYSDNQEDAIMMRLRLAP